MTNKKLESAKSEYLESKEDLLVALFQYNNGNCSGFDFWAVLDELLKNSKKLHLIIKDFPQQKQEKILRFLDNASYNAF